MRVLLHIALIGNRQIPLNYQYYIGSWLYSTIQSAHATLADFLHNHGFVYNGKAYKLMTFSPLHIFPFKIHKQQATIEAVDGTVQFELRFLVPQACQEFIKGLFSNQQFNLGSGANQVNGIVNQVEMLLLPEFNTTMNYRLLSPVCISHISEVSRYAQYLSPDHEAYDSLFVNHLISKSIAAATAGLIPVPAGADIDEPDIHFKITSPPRSKLLTAKPGRKDETKVRGFTYNFELHAPPEIHQIGYLCGFGEKNVGLGMGVGQAL